MRSQKKGALRDQAFVLEEMGKEILNKAESGNPVRLVDIDGDLQQFSKVDKVV
jgi:hypothetical protein